MTKLSDCLLITNFHKGKMGQSSRCLTGVSSAIKSVIDIDEGIISKEEVEIKDSKKSMALIDDIKMLIESRGSAVNKRLSIGDIKRFSNALGCYDAGDFFFNFCPL